MSRSRFIVFSLLFMMVAFAGDHATAKQLNLAADYVPQESDFSEPGGRDTFLSIGGLRGRQLKPIDGAHALFLTQVPGTGFGDKFAPGDIITHVQGKPLTSNAIARFKHSVGVAQRLAREFSWQRWRKGETETVGIKFEGRRPPDLTAGGYHHPDEDPWNLGATGAEGWIWAIPHKTTEGATQVYITQVKPGTPAEGVLKVGDVVVGAFGEAFTWDARKEFAQALAKAETKEHGGKLELMVWHEGVTRTATVPMKVMGRYSDTSPYDCAKTERIVDDAVTHFKKYGLENLPPDVGRQPNKSIYPLVNALGLLATGRDDVLPLVREKVEAIKLEYPSDHTWTSGYRLVLLTEYHLATGDRSVLDAIRANAQHLARGQSRVGTWGHRIAVPLHLSDDTLYGVAPGYGALNSPSVVCMIGLVLAQKCGVDTADIRKAVRRGSDFLRFFADKGAVPYGDHKPNTPMHDDNGKSSMTAVLFDLMGDDGASRYFIKASIASYNEREGGHTGNYFSFIWGALGAARGGDAAGSAFMKELEWFHDLERRVEGNFVYQGKPGMFAKPNSEHVYVNWDCTGARLLAFCLPRKALYITGKERSLPPITGDELEAALEAGRLNERDYLDLTTEALLEKLTSWSPTVRHHASLALESKDDNVVSELIAMLGSDNRLARYGALQGLQTAGRGSAEVADAVLTTLRDSEDETFKFFAVRAFSSYNLDMGLAAHAQRAANAMMRMDARGHFDEPTGKLRSEFAHAMFYSGNVQPFRAMARKGQGTEQLDHDLVVQTLRQMLKSTNGSTRSNAAVIYDKLTDEQLKQLWPDIYRATRELAPSGIMFASGVRTAGMELMAKHRTREGMETIAWYLSNQKHHGSDGRAPRLLKLLVETYGGHAKAVIPELEKAAAYYEPGGLAAPPWGSRVSVPIREAIERIKAAPTPDWEPTSIAEYLE